MAQQSRTRGEMFFLDLAKSKVILFAAKSCELIIFFGGLWLTMAMTNPSAASWAGGGINNFFLTTMGFAVDAAFPESWIHVVAQHIDQKKGQVGWSIAIAIAMSLLVAVNAISAELETNNHVSIPVWIITTLIIIRLLVGFCYVAIRECQALIDRKSLLAAPPALQFDPWLLVGLIAQFQQEIQQSLVDVQASFDQQLAELASKHQVTELTDRQSQKVNLVDLQVQRLLAEVQALQENQECLEPEPIDYQQLALALGPLFEQRMSASVSAIKTTIIEEVRATLPMVSGPPQIESRATSQGQKKATSKGPQKASPARGAGTPEERLQAAYDLLAEHSIRISGRVLAKEAKTSRDNANLWLSRVKGQSEKGQSGSGPESALRPVIEATVTVAPEPEK